MLEEVKAGQDPVKTMNVLKAIRWGTRAWSFDVQSKTVYNCFIKATMLEMQLTEPPSDIPEQQNIAQSIQQLQRLHYIQEAMDIRNFLNPEEEIVQDTPEEIEKQILA